MTGEPLLIYSFQANPNVPDYSINRFRNRFLVKNDFWAPFKLKSFGKYRSLTGTPCELFKVFKSDFQNQNSVPSLLPNSNWPSHRFLLLYKNIPMALDQAFYKNPIHKRNSAFVGYQLEHRTLLCKSMLLYDT